MSKEENSVDLAKDALKAARQELKSFMKENGIKEGKISKDEKLAKKQGKLQKNIEEAEAKLTEARKENRKPRESKYDYPDDCVTAEDKKKYRAKMRSKGKKKEDKKEDKKEGKKKDKSLDGKKSKGNKDKAPKISKETESDDEEEVEVDSEVNTQD